MQTIEALREKLGELVQDPFATEEELKALEHAIVAAEVAMAPLGLAETDQPYIPPILDAAIRNGEVGSALNANDIMTKDDYDSIVQIGRALGVDAARVSQIHSQLECVCKEASNTRIGLFALRALVENAYLHKQIGELNAITNHAVINLTNIHKPESKKKNANTRNSR